MKLKVSEPISQRDSEHANILLGNNTSLPYTIGNFGCLITVLTHYLKSLGKKTSVKQLNEKLKEEGGFVSGGLFTWIALYPDIYLEYTSERYDGVPTPASFFSSMRKALDEGYYLLLEIDFDPIQSGEQMHWVGVVGYEDDFIIMDPWTGKIVPLSVYGDPTQSTFRFRYYSKTIEISEEEDPCEEWKKKAEDYKKLYKDLAKEEEDWKKERELLNDTLILRNEKIDELSTENKRLLNQEFTLSEIIKFFSEYLLRKFGPNSRNPLSKTLDENQDDINSGNQN